MSSSPSISVKPKRPNPKTAISATKVQLTNLRNVENKARNRPTNLRKCASRPHERSIRKTKPNQRIKQRQKARRPNKINDPIDGKRQRPRRPSRKRNAGDMARQNRHKFSTRGHAIGPNT